jgi:hypothetical protein
MKSSELINELRLITQENISIIKDQIISFSSAQRKWKYENSIWNIEEIFMHLNDYADYYHATFLNKISKTRFKETKEIFVSSPLGRAAWRSMKLGNLNNIKKKMKSPKQYNPLINNKPKNDASIEEFLIKQEEMLKIIELADKVNLKKVKIPISISKIVRLRLGDALLFVNYHNQRHIQQVKNLIIHPNFPKS